MAPRPVIKIRSPKKKKPGDTGTPQVMHRRFVAFGSSNNVDSLVFTLRDSSDSYSLDPRLYTMGRFKIKPYKHTDRDTTWQAYWAVVIRIHGNLPDGDYTLVAEGYNSDHLQPDHKTSQFTYKGGYNFSVTFPEADGYHISGDERDNFCPFGDTSGSLSSTLPPVITDNSDSTNTKTADVSDVNDGTTWWAIFSGLADTPGAGKDATLTVTLDDNTTTTHRAVHIDNS